MITIDTVTIDEVLIRRLRRGNGACVVTVRNVACASGIRSSNGYHPIYQHIAEHIRTNWNGRYEEDWCGRSRGMDSKNAVYSVQDERFTRGGKGRD